MIYLLDTDICIYIIKHRPPEVRRRFEGHDVGDICVSAIAVAELEFGAAKSKWPAQARQALAQFLLPLVILDFDRAAAEAYGRLRAALEAQGKLIGANDMLIAAQAISAGLTLVSKNAREFGRVPGLRFENWGG